MSYTGFDFPHTHFYDDDLRELIKKVFDMSVEVKNFVSVNAIKYANPIQWDITRQYEKNTIVIDPISGTAYISVAAVPSGVALTRTEFWTVVFDLEQFVTKANGNFTIRVEEQTTLTATFPTPLHSWVIWGGDLYEAQTNIIAGDQYVVDSNIKKITIEEISGHLPDLMTTIKTNLVAAINSEVQARQDADAALQGAIDDEVQARQDADTALQDADTALQGAIDDEVQARQDADDALQTLLENYVNNVSGDLNDLVTTAKENLVVAINEVANMPKGVIVNVKDYGAVGDGVTNDYQAIVDAMNAADGKGLSIIYFPDGTYNCGNGSFTLDSSKYEFMGAANSTLYSTGMTSGAFITITSTFSLAQYDFARKPISKLCIKGSYFTDSNVYGVVGVKMGTDTTYMAPHSILENVVIRNFAVGLELSSAYKTTYLNCSFIANNRGVGIPSAGVQQAVPCEFISCWWECNNMGIYGLSGGFNSLTILGGAFEYNRSVISAYTKVVFIGVRFEFDAKASCEPNLTVRPVFTGSILAGSQTVQKYIGCFFLELNNFESNVTYWIPNAYKASAYDISRFYIIGGDPVSCEFALCEFESVNTISGYYYIGTDHFYGNGNYTKSIGGANMVNPDYVVTSTNGFIN